MDTIGLAVVWSSIAAVVFALLGLSGCGVVMGTTGYVKEYNKSICAVTNKDRQALNQLVANNEGK